MAIFAELNGNRVRTAAVTLPHHGIGHADVVLDSSTTSLSGVLTLVIGDFVFKGTAFRQGGFVGVNYFRIVGGAAGWGKKVREKEYRSVFGIKFSVIAQDAARECGETLSVQSDFTVGLCYDRQNAPAVRVLDTYAPQWWVGTDGVTVVGNRPTPTITSQFDVMQDGTDLGVGKITVATDHPAAWVPGARFSSPVLSEKQIAGVIHRLDKDKLRTQVWTF